MNIKKPFLQINEERLKIMSFHSYRSRQQYALQQVSTLSLLRNLSKYAELIGYILEL